jgi:hypothetical protein
MTWLVAHLERCNSKVLVSNRLTIKRTEQIASCSPPLIFLRAIVNNQPIRSDLTRRACMHCKYNLHVVINENLVHEKQFVWFSWI